jgi:hypothetical protein
VFDTATVSENRALDLSWVQAAASALAAVSSAVLLSTVGVAGTLVGAAVGSIAATVGTAVYKYYLSASQERMALAREVARERLARARAANVGHVGPSTEVVRAEEELHRVEEEEERQDEAPAAGRPAWGEALKVLPWKRIGLISAGLFVVVMGALLLFELVAGGPVSSFTGGTDRDHAPRTSIPFVGGTEEPEPSPTPTSTESPTPSESPSDTDSGTSTSTETASPTRSEPTATATTSATGGTATATTSSAPVPPEGTATP